MEAQRLVIRVGGMPRYFFPFLILVDFSVIGWTLRESYRNSDYLPAIVGLVVFGWLGAVFIVWMMGQKIEIHNGHLNAHFSLPGVGSGFWPKFYKGHIRIEDIRIFLVGNLPYFKANEKDFNDAHLTEIINIYENLNISGIGLLAKRLPLMYVISKHKDIQSFVIPAMQFSAKDVKQLISEMKKQNVAVWTDPRMGLEN